MQIFVVVGVVVRAERRCRVSILGAAVIDVDDLAGEASAEWVQNMRDFCVSVSLERSGFVGLL
jgi:hypothetical protein